MKKTKIEGELGKEIKSQFEQVTAIRNSIVNLSEAAYLVEKKMWEHLKKEFPDISDNCKLGIVDGDVILTDRLGD